MYYRGASAAIVVFDITHASSFQRAKKWIVELRQNVNNPNLIIALVGNKADLVDERTISEDEASSYAQELDLLYFETSAKENINVEELFNTIAERIPKVSSPAPQNPGVQLHQASPARLAQRSSCC
jgi:Ras-related protein Rab-5C